MGIEPTHLTEVVNAGGSSFVKSITVSKGAIVLAMIYNKLDPSGGNNPTISGVLTWTQLHQRVSGKTKMTLFYGLATSDTSGNVTIGFSGQNQQNVKVSIDQFLKTKNSGVNGVDALVQVKSNALNLVTASGISVTLDNALQGSKNIIYGFAADDSNRSYSTANGGSVLYTSPSNSMMAQYKINDNTLSWSWSSGTIIGECIAVEIRFKPISGGGFLLSMVN